MSSHEKSIAALKRKQNENNNVIQHQFEILGNTLTDLSDEVLSGTPFHESVRQIRAMRDLISDKEKTVSKWNEITGRMGEIDDAIKQTEAAIAGKREELAPRYEEIGEAALSAYLQNPESHGMLKDALSGALTTNENIREKERELESLETPTKAESFFSKTFAKGKGMVIRGSLRSKSAQRSKQLRDVGERISAMDLDEIPDDSPLNSTISSIEPVIDDLDGLRAKLEDQKEDREKAESERLEIEKRERMRNPVRNLQHEIERLRVQVDEQCLEVGKQLADTDMSSLPEDQRIAPVLQTIEEKREGNRQYSDLIDKLNAAIEVDRLSDEIRRKQRSKENLEKQISELDEEIKRLEEEKSERTKERGTLKSLKEAVSEEISEE